ncbi:MAG: hypothetical protein HRU38_07130 [Saccharospirillaceae bacterium]|nr:hypothetical protein [Pseudomonadales bacterium]NRB78428.1 hypothetical protein [Saccharospirillaceae bacterium]
MFFLNNPDGRTFPYIWSDSVLNNRPLVSAIFKSSFVIVMFVLLATKSTADSTISNNLNENTHTTTNISHDKLSNLLNMGLQNSPGCDSPIIPMLPKPNTKPNTNLNNSDWPIHNNGVGKLLADGKIPNWLLQRENTTLELLLNEGKLSDQQRAMELGLMDQDGFRIITLNSLDLRIRYSYQDLIMLLYPGETLRTTQGTGIGSTLAELVSAHESYTMTQWPEPYHCGVHVAGYEGVSFAFDSCQKACDGGTVQQVIVGGNDPWGEGEFVDKDNDKNNNNNQINQAFIEAFILEDGICFWSHLDAQTGSVIGSWPVESTKCPDRFNYTSSTSSDSSSIISSDNFSDTSSDKGSQLFAVQIDGKTALWRLDNGAKKLDILPTIHNLEFAWWEQGKLKAVTAHGKADDIPTPYIEEKVEDLTPLTAEELEEIMSEQWIASCFIYELNNNEWQFKSEQIIETYEGMRGPTCQDLVNNWSNTGGDYSNFTFDNAELVIEPNTKQVLHLGLLTGLQSSQKGQIMQRYAFSTDWYEGFYLTGLVARQNQDNSWSLLEDLKGELTEFFWLEEQLILCTENGFGAWGLNTERLWWRDNSNCPLWKIPGES